MATPSADQLRQLRKAGHAMAPTKPGGRPKFYIRNADDLDNAIRAVGRGGSDHDAIRRFVMKEARRLNLSSRIPDNWNADGSLKNAGSGSK